MLKDIEVGDVLVFIGDDLEKTVQRTEVLAVCGKMISTHDLNKDGSVGMFEWSEIKDMEAFGWKKE